MSTKHDDSARAAMRTAHAAAMAHLREYSEPTRPINAASPKNETHGSSVDEPGDELRQDFWAV